MSKTCGSKIKLDCDWRQGRCPHCPALWDQIKQWLKDKP